MMYENQIVSTSRGILTFMSSKLVIITFLVDFEMFTKIEIKMFSYINVL